MRLAAAGRTAPFTNEQTLLEIEQKFKDVRSMTLPPYHPISVVTDSM